MNTSTAASPAPARLGWFTAAAIAAWHWRTRLVDVVVAAGDAVLDFADKVAATIHQPADACDEYDTDPLLLDECHEWLAGSGPRIEMPGSTHGGVLTSPLDSPHHPPLYLLDDVHVPGDGLPWWAPPTQRDVPWGPYDLFPYRANR